MSVLSSLKSLLWKTKSGVGESPERENLQSQQNQAVPRPWTSDPVQQLYFTKGYTVRLKAGVKKVPLFRFLLAKLVYGREHEGISVEEFLVFHELFFELVDSKDPNLRKKWEPSFEKVSSIIPAMSEISEFPVVLDADSRLALRQILQDDPILPNPEAFFGLMGNRDMRNSFRVQFRSSWIPPKRVERYIGVGYKDKGSRRCPELDGSPSWQTVATVLANRERELEEAEAAYLAPVAE